MEAWLRGRKTYILAAGAFVAVIYAWANGHLPTTQAIEATWLAAITASLRGAIGKGAPK